MARHKCLRGLTLLGAFGALCSILPLAADQAQALPAGTPPAGVPKVPKITDVLFQELAEAPREVLFKPGSEKPLISTIQKMNFRLAIKGKDLPCTPTPDVFLETQDPGQPVDKAIVRSCLEDEIDVTDAAPVGTVIKSVRVSTGECKETAPVSKAASPGAKVSIAGGTATITDQETTIAGGTAKVIGEVTVTGTASMAGANATITDRATTISGVTAKTGIGKSQESLLWSGGSIHLGDHPRRPFG
jgi:hypothetical protein